MNNYEDIGFIFLGTIGYALYVQFSPKIGNIWYRLDSTGNKSFQFNSLSNLMIQTSTNSIYWKLNNLDINYIFVTYIFWASLKTIWNFIGIISIFNIRDMYSLEKN